ncbi:Stage II sporulation protein E [Turneriella parva DSM 21527]|uniref:Stage II sporulation protein E n=1 Tax=Turneriella parva (strain ATCC BAA-1111 / DSM 21527 / NCTC 11395 / H) TaxID=869212 RepID=I4B3M1_TURPD|nr:Stage II sporulation protein E [Turneriella parva DSM 21527]
MSRAFEAEARHKAQEELRKANELLEQKVEERTRELQASLTQVQALKDKQDADYYLTSLLLNPLATVQVNSPKVRVESLLVQKKQFVFKNRVYQLGGDFNIAETVTIGDATHLFLFNGDAMGKSIQGAGGALILGAILKVLLARPVTKANATPAAFLAGIYRRLNEVFLSLDGRMMISLTMAVISPDRSAYLISAEHPDPVLLAKGKARLVNVAQLPKLGSTRDDMPSDKIAVTRLMLAPGDLLILASDGRDDILLSGASGKVYNEDESLFCRLVERSDGSLRSIFASVESAGEVTDDFSAVSVLVE